MRQSVLIVICVLAAVVGLAIIALVTVLVVRRFQNQPLLSFKLPIRLTDDDREKLISKYQHRPLLLNAKIFVAISSYRDPELCPTIEVFFGSKVNPAD
jgi:hypothetical protein